MKIFLCYVDLSACVRVILKICCYIIILLCRKKVVSSNLKDIIKITVPKTLIIDVYLLYIYSLN